MRRNARVNQKNKKSTIDKMILYMGSAVIILGAVIFSLFMYSKRVSDEIKDSTLELGNITNSLSNGNEIDTESASTDIGKSVEEVQNEIDENTIENQTNTSNTVNANRTTNTSISNSNNNNSNRASSITTNAKTEDNTNQEKVELNFEKPVDGEIVKEFAKDNLLYSNTLKEWTTHLGIDIKAEKTTIVKAAEKGTIKSIKNDPRYGLTIVIDHGNGYESVYENLLTSEFVVEGEEVEKGQAIGTVGNTGIFEIADEPHLHFEILKDSIQENPTKYIGEN